MPSWEYAIWTFGPDRNQLPRLTQLGAQGWELVSAIQRPDGSWRLYFKRPTSGPPDEAPG